MKITIGTVTTTRKHTVRNTYEVAAWYQAVEVEAGLTGDLNYSDHASGYIHHPSFPGKVVASDFTSLFGGARIGSKIDSDVGQDATARGSAPYGYMLARTILESPDFDGTLAFENYRIDMDPRLSAEWHTFTPWTPEGEEPRDDITIPRLLWEGQPIKDALRATAH